MAPSRRCHGGRTVLFARSWHGHGLPWQCHGLPETFMTFPWGFIAPTAMPPYRACHGNATNMSHGPMAVPLDCHCRVMVQPWVDSDMMDFYQDNIMEAKPRPPISGHRRGVPWAFMPPPWKPYTVPKPCYGGSMAYRRCVPRHSRALMAPPWQLQGQYEQKRERWWW